METVTTERLVIRRPSEADLRDFLAYQTHPENLKYQPVEPLTEDKAAAFLAKQAALELGEEGGWVMFAVALRDGGRMIGEVGIYVEARKASAGNVGWSFHPEYQGQGYATEAAKALLVHAFQGLGLHRVTSGCDTRNAASFRLMERLGMRREGHLRQSQCRNGLWHDEYLYALLREEWLVGTGAEAGMGAGHEPAE